jgi:hypothetical protein
MKGSGKFCSVKIAQVFLTASQILLDIGVLYLQQALISNLVL